MTGARSLTSPPSRSFPRSPFVALSLVFSLVGLVLGLDAGSAQAAGYRYWSFWDGRDGQWAYASEGPATARPADGAVSGFRFSVSADSGDAARPRRTPVFGAVCANTPAQDGRKRIAVVIDSGTAADAPSREQPPALRAECARVGEDATAAEALAAVAKPLRYNGQALLCAISGYPASGCGEQVGEGERESDGKPTPQATPTLTPTPTPTTADGGSGSGGPSVSVFAGIAAVVALGAAGLWQARRRRG
ncbi:SCO2322 family protein [Streptomyces sp. NPDC088400]|uniref:SCO2322 family protein n=1 Tax=Streptomyces sp. NPDC088400 TaxID=3365861 RepID=UPI00382EAA18